MSSGITVITPTGGRPKPFVLCRRWMSQQTYAGAVQWIVVDDCIPSTVRPSEAITLVTPTPPWAGQNTLSRNLLTALDRVQNDRIVIAEDDDWISPRYLTRMAGALETHDIAGSCVSDYYHLPTGRYRSMRHPGRASLCFTGFRSGLIDTLRRVCEESPDYIDVRFWEATLSARRHYIAERLVVGIKGLPGRPGIGIGHQADGSEWQQDQNRRVLRDWIGSDIQHYQEFL